MSAHMEVTKKPSIRSDPQDPTALLSASRWSLDGDRLAEHLGIAMLRPSAEEAGMYLFLYRFYWKSVTCRFNKVYIV